MKSDKCASIVLEKLFLVSIELHTQLKSGSRIALCHAALQHLQRDLAIAPKATFWVVINARRLRTQIRHGTGASHVGSKLPKGIGAAGVLVDATAFHVQGAHQVEGARNAQLHAVLSQDNSPLVVALHAVCTFTTAVGIDARQVEDRLPMFALGRLLPQLHSRLVVHVLHFVVFAGECKTLLKPFLRHGVNGRNLVGLVHTGKFGAVGVEAVEPHVAWE